MKLNGVFGKGTGKVGESVWAVSGGVQIVRPYNPNVSNPNTPAQVEQRAKFKLLSQLAAVLGPVLGFEKKALTSARNQFVSANIDFVTFENETADIELSAIQLTGGNTALPEITATAGAGNVLNVGLATPAAENVGAVRYVVITTGADERIRIVGTKVVTTAGADRGFGTQLENITAPVDVYAYGIIFSSSTAKAKFDNYYASIERQDANLGVTNSQLLAGAVCTVTKFKEVSA